jgi:hypothetical protein
MFEVSESQTVDHSQQVIILAQTRVFCSLAEIPSRSKGQIFFERVILTSVTADGIRTAWSPGEHVKVVAIGCRRSTRNQQEFLVNFKLWNKLKKRRLSCHFPDKRDVCLLVSEGDVVQPFSSLQTLHFDNKHLLRKTWSASEITYVQPHKQLPVGKASAAKGYQLSDANLPGPILCDH